MTVKNLICSTRRIREEKAERPELLILVFDQVWAADTYTPNFIEPDSQSRMAEKHMRAMYFFSGAEQREYLAMFPFGSELNNDGLNKYDSTIHLPPDGSPHRGLELDGRCLLALDDVDLEGSGGGGDAAGSVTLTATVTRAGQIRDIKLKRNTVTPSSAKGTLAKAVKNLKTWWLEPASRESHFEVVYNFGAPIRSEPDSSGMNIDLPDKISIQANAVHQK